MGRTQGWLPVSWDSRDYNFSTKKQLHLTIHLVIRVFRPNLIMSGFSASNSALSFSADPSKNFRGALSSPLSIGLRCFRVEDLETESHPGIVFILIEPLKTQFSSWIDWIPGLRDLHCGQTWQGVLKHISVKIIKFVIVVFAVIVIVKVLVVPGEKLNLRVFVFNEKLQSIVMENEISSIFSMP